MCRYCFRPSVIRPIAAANASTVDCASGRERGWKVRNAAKVHQPDHEHVLAALILWRREFQVATARKPILSLMGRERLLAARHHELDEQADFRVLQSFVRIKAGETDGQRRGGFGHRNQRA